MQTYEINHQTREYIMVLCQQSDMKASTCTEIIKILSNLKPIVNKPNKVVIPTNTSEQNENSSQVQVVQEEKSAN